MSAARRRLWLARCLEAELGVLASQGMRAELAPFQNTGSAAIERALSRWGGALLADEVGMGKTHTALSIIAGRGPALVCAPASLLGMWRRALAEAGIEGCRLCSHALLARGVPQSGVGLVVVDEAHAFVNPKTRRAQALSVLGARAPLLLLTATPIGLSAEELCHLVRLFLPVGALAPVLGETLEEHLARQGDDPDLRVLLRTVVVRRPRSFIQRRWPEGIEVRRPDGRLQRLAFPRRVPVPLPWSTEAVSPGALPRLLGLVERLDEVALGLSPGLLRCLLLSRLESSPAALEASVRRLEGFLLRRIEAASEGRSMDRRAWRRLFGGLAADEDRQLVLPFIFDEASGSQEVAAGTWQAQLVLVRRILALAGRWRSMDPKFEVLCGFLAGRPSEERTIVFTRFRDTAVALREGLSRRFPEVGVGAVCGGQAWLGRQRAGVGEVLRRFEAPGLRSAEALRFVVATDVLAEGHDLRGCHNVVSYDLPWNPRRLVQRFGRIDRLGVGDRTIRAVLMVPDRGFESWLGVLARVGARAQVAEAILGDVGGLRDQLGWDGRGGSRASLSSPEVAAGVEFELRADLLALGPLPAELPPLPRGWALSATPRTPPGTLFLIEPGVEGALVHWCFVPAAPGAALEESRHRLYGRLRGLLRRPATPLERPDAKALRRALASALEVRRRLLAAMLRPHTHPPASPEARLLRQIAAEPSPAVHDVPALGRRSALMKALRRPLSAHRRAGLDDALRRGVGLETVVEEVLASAAPAGVPGAAAEVRVLGFVAFL